MRTVAGVPNVTFTPQSALFLLHLYILTFSSFSGISIPWKRFSDNQCQKQNVLSQWWMWFRYRPHLKPHVVRGVERLVVVVVVVRGGLGWVVVMWWWRGGVEMCLWPWTMGRGGNSVCKRANIHKFAQCEIWGHLFALLKKLKQHKLPTVSICFTK